MGVCCFTPARRCALAGTWAGATSGVTARMAVVRNSNRALMGFSGWGEWVRASPDPREAQIRLRQLVSAHLEVDRQYDQDRHRAVRNRCRAESCVQDLPQRLDGELLIRGVDQVDGARLHSAVGPDDAR